MKNWNVWALVAVAVVFALWLWGCTIRTAPPPEIVEDLKLSPAQVDRGYTAAELDALFLRWQNSQKAAGEEKAKAAEKADAKAKADAAAKTEETAAKVDTLRAEAGIELADLESKFRGDVARLNLKTDQSARDVLAAGRVAINAVLKTGEDAVESFRLWANGRTDRAASVASGIEAGKADIADREYLRSTLAQAGLQAATPYLPAGLAALASGAIMNILGKRTGAKAATEPTRALMSAIKSAGVGEAVGRFIPEHAEGDDAAVIAKIGIQDNVSIPIPAAKVA